MRRRLVPILIAVVAATLLLVVYVATRPKPDGFGCGPVKAFDEMYAQGNEVPILSRECIG